QRDALASPSTGWLGLTNCGHQSGAEIFHARRDVAGPDHAVDATFGPTSARAEIKPAVRTHGDIRDVERLTFEKHLGGSLIRGAVRLGLDRQNSATRPIAGKDR